MASYLGKSVRAPICASLIVFLSACSPNADLFEILTFEEAETRREDAELNGLPAAVKAASEVAKAAAEPAPRPVWTRYDDPDAVRAAPAPRRPARGELSAGLANGVAASSVAPAASGAVRVKRRDWRTQGPGAQETARPQSVRPAASAPVRPSPAQQGALDRPAPAVNLEPESTPAGAAGASAQAASSPEAASSAEAAASLLAAARRRSQERTSAEVASKPPSAADPTPEPLARPRPLSSPNLAQYRSDRWRVGGYVKPVPGAQLGLVKESRPKDGVDFPGAVGADVKAVAEGRVTFVSASEGALGAMMVISHPDGLASVYTRLRNVSVQYGDRIEAGASIAQIGAPPPGATPRLRLQLRRGAEAVDPRPYFK